MRGTPLVGYGAPLVLLLGARFAGVQLGDVDVEEEDAAAASHSSGSQSRKPLANGLLAILSCVIRWFWYAVTAVKRVSGNENVLKFSVRGSGDEPGGDGATTT